MFAYLVFLKVKLFRTFGYEPHSFCPWNNIHSVRATTNQAILLDFDPFRVLNKQILDKDKSIKDLRKQLEKLQAENEEKQRLMTQVSK